MKAKKGAGLRFLTETITSPTLAAQMKSILADFPEAKWHQYEPVNRDNARAGAMMAFGQPVNTIYDFSKADRILSLGSDFLSAMPGTLRYARDYAAKRRISGDKARDESAVCDREHADDDGRGCGSSVFGEAERDGSFTGLRCLPEGAADEDRRFSNSPGSGRPSPQRRLSSNTRALQSLSSATINSRLFMRSLMQ